MTRLSGLLARAAGLFCAAAVALAACGGSGGSDSQAAAGTDPDAALAAGGTLTVWAWEPTLTQVVKDFQAKYPKVHVNLVNAGTGGDEYKALQNAVAAGKGLPDIAQIEYYALGQFAIGDSLTDLGPFGATSLDGTFTAGPWNGVHSGGKVYGLPMDSGPMALFYNKKVFDTYHLKVPTTWDEYIADAEALHTADPTRYITADMGDPGFTTSLIWQAGGHPYTVDGTSVKIDFANDQGTKTVAAAWQKLIDEKLLAPVAGWSDAWYKGLGDGTIATLPIGAWMPATLESNVTGASGDWRVAPMPQWTAGEKASAEQGGSSLAIPAASTHKALAYAFTRYATVGEGAATRISLGAFPATVKDLNDTAYLDKSYPYFGGQKINKIFAESAAEVLPGWTYLPFQVYANSVYSDTVGKAYVSGTSVLDGLAAWQQKSVDYGSDQGFTVTP